MTIKMKCSFLMGGAHWGQRGELSKTLLFVKTPTLLLPSCQQHTRNEFYPETLPPDHFQKDAPLTPKVLYVQGLVSLPCQVEARGIWGYKTAWRGVGKGENKKKGCAKKKGVAPKAILGATLGILRCSCSLRMWVIPDIRGKLRAEVQCKDTPGGCPAVGLAPPTKP